MMMMMMRIYNSRAASSSLDCCSVVWSMTARRSSKITDMVEENGNAKARESACFCGCDVTPFDARRRRRRKARKLFQKTSSTWLTETTDK